MKVISELVEIRPKQLYVPRNHRANPSLQGESSVNCALIPPEKGAAAPDLVFSQFPLSSWGDLWLIDLRVKDKKGVLHRVAEKLSKANVNLLSTEVTPVHGNTAAISLVADLVSYQDHYQVTDPDTDKEVSRSIDRSSQLRFDDPAPSIRNLEDCLTLELIDDLEVVEGRPEIRTRRLHELHAIKRSIVDDRNLTEEHVPIVDGVITLPDTEVWRGFRTYQIPGRENNFALITSDTQQGYLRFTPVISGRTYLTIDVKMKNEAGQLLQCTKALSEKVSIKTAFETLHRVDDGASWRALLEIEGEKSESEFKLEVTELLRGVGFEAVTFPPPIAFGSSPDF